MTLGNMREHAEDAERARSALYLLKEGTAPMPLLTSLGESGHCELYADNVYFFMTYGGHRIRCGITDKALEILEPLLDQTGKGRLAAFDAHRATIEHMASTKFDNKMWERDGITILVQGTDIKNIEAT
jgi:Protein of unknown function (DUF1488).